MESRFHHYLRAERLTGILLVAWALLAAAVAAWAYISWGGSLFFAVLATVTAFCLLQLYLGIRRIWKALRLRRELDPIVKVSPPSFCAYELPRLDNRLKSARRRRFIENAFLILGICFMVSGILRFSGLFILGAGIGLSIQAAVLLITTLTSQWRDALYRYELEKNQNP